MAKIPSAARVLLARARMVDAVVNFILMVVSEYLGIMSIVLKVSCWCWN